MDATAVAAARGMAARSLQVRHVLAISSLFGGFQALMLLIGWLVGARLGPTIQTRDHWIAFALLSALGGKMLSGSARQARRRHGAAAGRRRVVPDPSVARARGCDEHRRAGRRCHVADVERAVRDVARDDRRDHDRAERNRYSRRTPLRDSAGSTSRRIRRRRADRTRPEDPDRTPRRAPEIELRRATGEHVTVLG